LGNDEINVEAVFPLQVWPLDSEPILAAVSRTGKLLVIEEGATGYDLASEVIAEATLAYRGGTPLRARRIGARPMPIPSAVELERAVLPSEDAIVAASLELFDD
jgi:pyruvate/2-oxoglutarate/acetoin dehydrogenase E1 component